jgi:hypothetical protein
MTREERILRSSDLVSLLHRRSGALLCAHPEAVGHNITTPRCPPLALLAISCRFSLISQKSKQEKASTKGFAD